jgi:hypothetical protein
VLLAAQLTATLPELVAGTLMLAGAGGGNSTVVVTALLQVLQPPAAQACT